MAESNEIVFAPAGATASLPTAGGFQLIAKLDPRGVAALEALYRIAPQRTQQALAAAVNAAAVYGNKLVLRAITSRLNVKRRDIAGKHSPRYGGVVLKKAAAVNPTATITVSKASSKLESGWKTEAGRLPLILFVSSKVAHTGPYGGCHGHGRQPPSYTITPGMHKRVPHSFIATMKSGHRGLFIRGRFLMGLLSSLPHVGAEAPEEMIVRMGKGFMRVSKGAVWRGEGEGWEGNRLFGRGQKRRITPKEPIYQLYGPSLTRVVERAQQLQRAMVVDVSDRLNKRLVSQLERFTGTPTVKAPALVELERGGEGGDNG